MGLASYPCSDFLSCSPLYTASHFHLRQMHNCLLADVRLAGMLDTHPCFISPFVLPDRPLQSTLEPRSRSTPEATTTTSSSSLTRSSLEVPRKEASPFRSLLFLC